MWKCPSSSPPYQWAPQCFSHRMKNGGEKKKKHFVVRFFFSFVLYLRLTNDLCQIPSAGITNVLMERERAGRRGEWWWRSDGGGVMVERGIWFERLAEKGISFDGDAPNLPHHVTAVCEFYSSTRWRETAGSSQDFFIMAALFFM